MLRIPYKGDYKKTVLAITIAFENVQVIQKQINQFLRNKVKPSNLLLVVVDNSLSKTSAADIRKICKINQVDYYRIRKNIYSGTDPSKSHGYALNWATGKVVPRYRSEWFGFLDHDVFLLRDVEEFLKQLTDARLAYGVVNAREEKWYFWPGFCFFRRDYFDLKKVNFMPAPGLDTGGMLWREYLKELSSEKYGVASLKTIYPQDSKSKNKQKDAYQIIDDMWLHLINASNWANVDMRQKQQKLGILVDELTARKGEREEVE